MIAVVNSSANKVEPLTISLSSGCVINIPQTSPNQITETKCCEP